MVLWNKVHYFWCGTTGMKYSRVAPVAKRFSAYRNLGTGALFELMSQEFIENVEADIFGVLN